MDNDEQVQTVLRGIWEEAGYIVVVASNGQQGSCGFSPPHLDSRAVMTDPQGTSRTAGLIVDDEPDISEVLPDHVRHEGDDARANIQKAAFHTVIFHVRLPDQERRVCSWSSANSTLSGRSSCTLASWMGGSPDSMLAPVPVSSNTTPRLSCERGFVERQGGRRDCDRHGDHRTH